MLWWFNTFCCFCCIAEAQWPPQCKQHGCRQQPVFIIYQWASQGRQCTIKQINNIISNMFLECFVSSSLKRFSKVLWQLIAKLAMCFRSIQTSSNKQRIIVLHFENKIRSKNQVSNIFCERNIVTHNINWPNVSANVLRHQQIEL